MSEEIKEKDPQSQKRRRVPTEPPQPVFRRREDEIRFEIIEKILSMLKYSVFLVIATLYFFYSVITTQNTTDAYQIKLLNETLEKLNKQEQLLENRFNYGVTKKALPGTCIVCHAPGRFDIILPKDWKMDTFKDYVRGTVRVPDNKIMPAFDKNTVSDQQLEEIFTNLKQ